MVGEQERFEKSIAAFTRGAIWSAVACYRSGCGCLRRAVGNLYLLVVVARYPSLMEWLRRALFAACRPSSHPTKAVSRLGLPPHSKARPAFSTLLVV
jgi:hypothetical protein